MDHTHVVTCFLRNRCAVLLRKQTNVVGSESGLWGGVSGETNGASEEQAHRVVEAATGLGDQTKLVRSGTPLSVAAGSNTERVVYPYLFDCDSRTLEPAEETREYEWVSPVELHRRETVAGLWAAYARVSPTVDTIARDEEHGAEYLSLRALEVLRDVAAAQEYGETEASLTALARRLQRARPSMSVVENRINRVLYDADHRVLSTAKREIERAQAAREAAASVAAAQITAERVLTLSRSGTVRETLDRLDCSVLVARSRPGGEGVSVAHSLAETTDVTLFPDAAVAHALSAGVDAVLVGADTVLADGRVVNKVGTRTAALAAAHEEIEVYAVATADKISGTDENEVDLDHDTPSVSGEETPISVLEPTFDVTPPNCVTLITENGVQSVADIERIAQRHREHATWKS